MSLKRLDILRMIVKAFRKFKTLGDFVQAFRKFKTLGDFLQVVVLLDIRQL
jgi:hypothetical protein